MTVARIKGEVSSPVADYLDVGTDLLEYFVDIDK